MLWAIGEAAPGDVLVVQAGGAPLAALGELLATEAARRGLGGIVVDGYVRDRPGCRRAAAVGAGTVPMAGRSDVAPRVGGPSRSAACACRPGDLVLGDDDGGRSAAGRSWRPAWSGRGDRAGRGAVLGAVRAGESLIDMTNLVEHVAGCARGEIRSLAITPPS